MILDAPAIIVSASPHKSRLPDGNTEKLFDLAIVLLEPDPCRTVQFQEAEPLVRRLPPIRTQKPARWRRKNNSKLCGQSRFKQGPTQSQLHCGFAEIRKVHRLEDAGFCAQTVALADVTIPL